MKTRRFVFCISLIVSVFFASCFSPWSGDEGSLTIVWGKSASSRYFVSEEYDMPYFDYEITLTGPGETVREVVSYNTAFSKTFTVAPGTWTVTIKGGYLETYTSPGMNDSYFYLRALGIEQVDVKSGKNAPTVIPMYTATEVYSWDQLESSIAFNDFDPIYNPDANSREEVFVLKGPFNEDNEDNIAGTTISITRPIILVAENDVTLVRPDSARGHDRYNPFFAIYSGQFPGLVRLTLGLPGMAGTLTLDNGGEDSSSLVNVYSSGALVMNSGVTIKGFSGVYGGGVYVMSNGTFTMNGGTIRGNEASASGPGAFPAGGGVFVEEGGTYNGKGGSLSNNSPANVFHEESLVIAPDYREGEWQGSLNAGVNALPVTFTENSITDGLYTMQNVYTGVDHEFKNTIASGKWAYLFERDQKIGIIYYYTDQETGLRFASFKLGWGGVDYFFSSNDLGLSVDPEDYGDIYAGDYNGSGDLFQG